jgi:Phasin protein
MDATLCNLLSCAQGGLPRAPKKDQRERSSSANKSTKRFIWRPCLSSSFFSTIATEWQGFVSRRLQEDLTLTQRLSQCRTPEQILAAYTDFWHKAVEEYGKELTTMTKLATGVTRNMVLRAPSIAAEKPAESYASQKAAA